MSELRGQGDRPNEPNEPGRQQEPERPPRDQPVLDRPPNRPDRGDEREAERSDDAERNAERSETTDRSEGADRGAERGTDQPAQQADERDADRPADHGDTDPGDRDTNRPEQRHTHWSDDGDTDTTRPADRPDDSPDATGESADDHAPEPDQPAADTGDGQHDQQDAADGDELRRAWDDQDMGRRSINRPSMKTFELDDDIDPDTTAATDADAPPASDQTDRPDAATRTDGQKDVDTDGALPASTETDQPSAAAEFDDPDAQPAQSPHETDADSPADAGRDTTDRETQDQRTHTSDEHPDPADTAEPRDQYLDLARTDSAADDVDGTTEQPPSGQELVEMESDEGSKWDNFRKEAYTGGDTLNDAVHIVGDGLSGIVGPRPTGSHQLHRPLKVVGPQREGLDGGDTATAVAMVAVMGFEAYRWSIRQLLGRNKGA